MNQQETSKRNRFNMELHYSSSLLVTNIESFINLPTSGNAGSARTEVDYRFGPNSRDERLVLSTKWRNEIENGRGELSMNG